MFHPDRPYFVNLAYLYEVIFHHLFKHRIEYHNGMHIVFKDDVSSDYMLKHYLKYLNKFGPEDKLPGFLMTNQEMLTFIQFQSKCSKYQNGGISKYSLKKGNIFNCPV